MRKVPFGGALAASTLVLSFCLVSAKPVAAVEPDLTFFGWSDQHVETDGRAEHLVPAVEAMNGLPGTPFPEAIGGTVGEPTFVFGCGDVTEWPTRAAVKSYDTLISARLRWKTYEVLGNHDEGGQEPVETMKEWIVRRHGGLSYAFDAGGVRFLVMYSKYDERLGRPDQPLTKESLQWLRSQLEGLPRERPVIVATHLCCDAITNRDELVDTLRAANVFMVLGGHYHKAKVDRRREIDFVQLPSPAPKNGSREVTVVRVSGDRLVAIPYSYEKKGWVTTPGKVLDKRVKR